MRGVAAVWVALALAACGGSSPPKPNDAALKRGLLTSGELAGMVPQPLSIAHGAKAWAQPLNLTGAPLQTELARLRRIGFVAGATEQLSAPGNRNKYGLTLVEQFSSAKGPPAEIAHTTSMNGSMTIFAVPGVPDAHGFDQAGSAGGRNIAFGHGDYMYLIGSGWQSGAANAVPRAKMIVVAQQLYKRVAG